MKNYYRLSYSHAHRHALDVEYQISHLTGTSTLVQLPTWRPGRYELGNFAKNIQKFAVYGASGKALKYEKVNSHRWEIALDGETSIVCKYTYYAADLNAGSTYLSTEMLYANPVNCLLYQVDALDYPCEMKLALPADYQLAIALPHSADFVVSAPNCHELFDSPFIASASLQSLQFEWAGSKVYLHFQGECELPAEQLCKDFKQFYVHQLAIFGEAPFSDYHFLFHLVPQPQHHGVEHQASTVIAMGPASAQFSTAYNEFLAISSHELFHAWNIKAIRPAEMCPYDYTRENYSKLGYVCEGVTTLMGDLTLLRSGVWGIDQFLEEFSGECQKHFDNFGRFNYSVAQSSFDTWLDGYTAGVPNRKVSIYTEGSILALIADVMLCKASNFKHSLYDVMHKLYHNFYKKGKGYTEADYQAALEHFSGVSFQNYFEKYIWGTEEYTSELQTALDFLGLILIETRSAQEHESDLGLKISPSGLITAIYPDGPADRAGLWVDDKIIIVNGFVQNPDGVVWNDKFGSGTNKITIVRMHKTIELTLTADDGLYYKHYQVLELPGDNEKKENLQRWINCNLPGKI